MTLLSVPDGKITGSHPSAPSPGPTAPADIEELSRRVDEPNAKMDQ
ncbi:hypothetical protein [Streptomyces sp. NPDC059828]